MKCNERALTAGVGTAAGLNVPWWVREVEGLSEVEPEEIIGVWSGSVGKLVVGVCFTTIDPEGLLDDGVCLAPSKRSVNMGG